MAQFFEVVDNGLINAQYIYKGLERPMYCGEDRNADGSKYAYTWKSTFDAYWHGSRAEGLGGPRRCAAPSGRVFVVIVSPNDMKYGFPEITGWIENWSWILESQEHPGAPIDCDDRYTHVLWRKREGEDNEC